MEPDRQFRVEQLVEEALELEEKQRCEFLERHCGGDESLRREVESLLARQNDRLILDRSTQLAGDPTMTVLNPGARLGPTALCCNA